MIQSYGNETQTKKFKTVKKNWPGLFAFSRTYTLQWLLCEKKEKLKATKEDTLSTISFWFLSCDTQNKNNIKLKSQMYTTKVIEEEGGKSLKWQVNGICNYLWFWLYCPLTCVDLGFVGNLYRHRISKESSSSIVCSSNEMK